eukprot:673882-Prymnesium_polylepis.1
MLNDQQETTLLDIPDDAIALVLAAGGGEATAHASAACTKLRRISQAQALWAGICSDIGLGGEMLTTATNDEGIVDYRLLFRLAHHCEHKSRRARLFLWDGDDPTMKLWLKPSLGRIDTTSHCARCGRGFSISLEAVHGDEDDEGAYPGGATSLVTQVEFRCHASGKQWRECWYDDFYYQ